MGCFLCSTKKTSSNSNTKLQTTTTHRSPPSTLSFVEQEQVKEILSETPVIINNPIIHSNEEKNNISNIQDSHVFKIARIFNPKELNRVGSNPKEMAEELSRNIRVGSDTKESTKELKRVGSDPREATKHVSRHIRVGSNSKETIGEFSRSIRVGSDPKETIKDVWQRSPAKYRNTSPARRSDHLPRSGQIRNTSPARRSNHLSGSGQIRNTSPAKRSDHLPWSGLTRNNSLSRVGSSRNTGGLSRKDNGESSCRRSRPPVICGDQTNGGTRNSISRCPSARKSGKSPGRVRSELGDRRRVPAEAGINNNYKKPLTSGIDESVENPLLSFECFIFI